MIYDQSWITAIAFIQFHVTNLNQPQITAAKIFGQMPSTACKGDLSLDCSHLLNKPLQSALLLVLCSLQKMGERRRERIVDRAGLWRQQLPQEVKLLKETLSNLGDAEKKAVC